MPFFQIWFGTESKTLLELIPLDFAFERASPCCVWVCAHPCRWRVQNSFHTKQLMSCFCCLISCDAMCYFKNKAFLIGMCVDDTLCFEIDAAPCHQLVFLNIPVSVFSQSFYMSLGLLIPSSVLLWWRSQSPNRDSFYIKGCHNDDNMQWCLYKNKKHW